MTLVKSNPVEHQYELGNGSFAQVDSAGSVTIYNEDNIVVLNGSQTEALKYALGFYDLPPERLCGACGRPIPEGGSLHCGLDHAPIVRCDECGNEIDPATCHCGACIIGHPPDHAFVPIGCECTRSHETEVKP